MTRIYTIDNHTHAYCNDETNMPWCDLCGLLKSTIEGLDKADYAVCIKCKEKVRERGYTTYNAGSEDGWKVAACDNPTCERYGLLTTIYE